VGRRSTPTAPASADGAPVGRGSAADPRVARHAQAQAQGVDNFSKVAGAARDLGNAPVEGPNALAKLVDATKAKATLRAAQTPVTS
jgi:hypothetical protein